jgi:mono/diheme cytochrome c family protein/glucose/arabinose dehydrogenase
MATIGALGGRSPRVVDSGGTGESASEGHSPILSPQEAIEDFRIDPRFRVSVAASEPAVEAPVAMAFDEDGRIWVVEMRAYMRDTEGTKELDASGRIVVLEDRDGDGVYEARRVFLEGLVLPRAVAPCHGGALVIAPPDLFFARDTDGDGRADERRVLMTGLGGLENPEHAANGVMYGLDNWWHLAQHTSEFRFDGERVETRGTPVVGQWGLTQDEEGRLYYTPNSEALRVDLFPKHYASRNADAWDLPGLNQLASPDQTVWPAPATRGVNRGYMEKVLRGDGTLASHTAACGPSLYFASLFPPDCKGNVYVCEPAGNLLRRLEVTETTKGPVAWNAYERTEFLTSTDERFRPVNTCVGPDGALYVVDMHRGVIQHKMFLTPYLKEQIKARGLETPLHMGRVYRIEPKEGTARAMPRLSGANNATLVRHLGDEDAWWRRTAQRLLVERRAVGEASRLRELSRGGGAWTSRLHALWTLDGLGVMVEEDLMAAMEDEDPRVRAVGVRLCERRASPAMVERVRGLARDAAAVVRRQVALSIAEMGGERVLSTLIECVAADPGDDVMHACVLTSARGLQRELLLRVMDRGLEKRGWKALGERLTASLVQAKSPDERVWLLEQLVRSEAEDSGRGSLLLTNVERLLKPQSRRPRVVHLAREPEGWGKVVGRADDFGRRMKALGECLEWPGKPSPVAAKEPRALTTRERALYERGERVYSLCYSCHGASGMGTPGQAPALDGSALAQGPSGAAIRILLHGLEASMVGSTMYPVMPPVTMNDESAAAVLTYVRRAWSNTGEPILPEEVRRVREETLGRKRPWTRVELEAMR